MAFFTHKKHPVGASIHRRKESFPLKPSLVGYGVLNCSTLHNDKVKENIIQKFKKILATPECCPEPYNYCHFSSKIKRKASIETWIYCILGPINGGGYISFSDSSHLLKSISDLIQRKLLSSFSNVKRCAFSNLPI